MWDLESELREAQRIGSIGSWCWDAETDVVQGSEELCRILGFESSHGELPDFQALRGECFPDQDWERIQEAMDEALVSGEEFKEEVRAIREGRTLWVAMRARPFRDKEGRFMGVRGTVQDISERKRNELNAAFLARTQEGFSRVSSAQGLVQSLGAKIGAYLKAPLLNVCEVEGNGSKQRLRLTYQWFEEGLESPVDRPLLMECIKEAYRDEICGGDVAVIRDIEKDGRIHTERCNAYGVRSMVIVPFQAEEKWKYFLSVADRIPRDWRIDEITLVQEVANRIFPRLAQARFQEALRGSEERLQTALEGGELGTWDLNLVTGEVTHSRRHDKIWGLTEPPEDWNIETALERVLEEDRDRFLDSYRRALETGELSEEMRIRIQENGRVRWIATRGRVGYDEEGQPVRITGVVADITERKASEEALRRSEERLKLAVKNAAFVSSESDRELRYTWIFNPHSDFDPHHVLGKTDIELENTPGARRLFELKKEVLKKEEGRREEIEFQRSDGRRVYDMIIEPRQNACGVLVGVSTVSFDVTERREAEEALLEADRRKDEFIAVLSHELRNPLTPIRAGIELLKDAYDRPSSRAMVPVLERQVIHISHLLDDLLNLSRIRQGKLKLNKERLALKEAIEGALEATGEDIRRKGHSLEVQLEERPIILEADPVRVSQVFSNLLTNAAKYMDAGGCIVVSSKVKGEEVVISVKDKGIGISAAQLPTIFDMFSQVEHSEERSSRFHEGLGIGLSLVKELVELHGGRVEARSAGLGKGSEFRVYLPILEDHQPARFPSASKKEKQRRKILVVDDNRDISFSLAMILEIIGHDVATANRGAEALALMEKYRPDIVLLDIGMPDMDGYEVCRRIRETSYGRETIIIALTGWGQEEDRRKSQEAGFDAHLVKPLDMEKLKLLLDDLEKGSWNDGGEGPGTSING